MSDRGLAYIITAQAENQTSYAHGLYASTTRHGMIWPELVSEALAFAVERWDDPPSLLRVLLSRLYADLGESIYGGSVGFAITESDYPVVCLDLARKEAGYAILGREKARGDWTAMTFSTFCRDPQTYPDLVGTTG